MKIKTKLKLALLIVPIMLIANFQVVFAAEEDAPPSLVIGDFEDEEAPPSVNITIPDDDEEEAPPSLNITLPDDNPDQPPQEEEENDNPDQPPGNNDGDTNDVKLTKVSISPQKLNPIIDEAKISYKISKQAKIEVKILDANGQTVATLVDDQIKGSGSHSVNWYGTKDNAKNAKAVSAGIYKYKVIAKTLSGQTKDTKEGNIEIFYGQVQTPKADNQNGDPDQAKATVTLNNSTSGKTAETGPGILIYPLIPLAAWVIKKKIIKK